MTDVVIHGDVAETLQRISEQEKRPVDDVLRSLIERYTAESEASTETAVHDTQENKHWGREVLALLDQLDLSEWDTPDTADPVEWVKEQRRQQARHREISSGDE